MTKKKEHPEKRWRKTKFTEECVKKLEEIFKIDWTVEEACWYAWISRRAYYDECNRNPEFLYRMETAMKFPFIFARKVLMKSMNSKNEWIALKAWSDFLNKRDLRYSNKNVEIQQPYEPDKDDVERERIKQLLEKRYWKDE